eukprot:gene44349-59166_t
MALAAGRLGSRGGHASGHLKPPVCRSTLERWRAAAEVTTHGDSMRFFSLGLIAAAASLTGCASIVNGQNQSVSVETRVDTGPVVGAYCTLNNNKGTWFVTTPGSATVQRSFEDLSVKCTKDQMEPGMTSVKSATKGMAFGNILFGGPIGAGVDMASGAAYDYPNLITVMRGTTSTVGTPAQEPPKN